MATTTTSSRNLVSVGSILFIRPQTLRIDVFDARPNTRLYPFFDDERIDSMVRPGVIPIVDDDGDFLPYATSGVLNPTLETGDLGDPLVTDSNGRLVAFFEIPGGRFNTGDKEIMFTDTEDLSLLEMRGSLHGSARAIFSTNGTTQIFQRTTVETTIVEFRGGGGPGAPDPALDVGPKDPLAQSFFTFGHTGGVVLTGLDLYFQSKDERVPVRVELRPLVNGFPGPLDNVNPDYVIVKSASSILVSNDASVPTRFNFNVPIYLPEDSEYCFVVRSNSKNYNIWTSRLGERSVETGFIIHEQPYVGSMFKSENNITWTPEQFEDIKFTLYKAEFDTNASPVLEFVGSAPLIVINGNDFTTTSGSSLVVVKTTQFHGLQPGSKIQLAGDVGATYNGIPSANLTGFFDVTRKIDDYFFEFNAGANASSSGKISSCGIVRSIAVLDGGSGYTSTPTVTIGAPTSGTTAAATAVISNGKIVRIDITNSGSGYTSNPSVVITGTGTGASALAITEAIFTINTNVPINWISPQFKYSILPGTEIPTTISAIDESYGYAVPVDARIDRVKKLSETRMIASRVNELNMLSDNPSFSLNLTLHSSNKNVSPLIDLRERTSVIAYTNAINNQGREEDVDELVTSATTTLTGYTITNGGTGYASAPAVTVVPAENDRNKDNIIDATMTATVAGGIVTALDITSVGSGYTAEPIIKIAPPSSGTTATATSSIGAFNSELMTSGSAYSRYLTKKIRLATVSSGVRVLVSAQSTPETTFDWYIRTSLSSDSTKHSDATWRLLKCDVPRDRSSNANQFFEYEFYLDDIPSFDTYDMKMVPSSVNRAKIPQINRYRTIVIV